MRDPLTGQPFPGNRIPADRINRNGQALLGVFPLPNQFDRNVTRGAYNYTFQESLDVPKRQHVFRVDFGRRIAIRSTSAAALVLRQQGYAVPAGTSNWGLLGLHYTFTDDSVLGNWTRILSPSMVNEMSVGARRSEEAGPPLDDERARAGGPQRRGLPVGQFTPADQPARHHPAGVLHRRAGHAGGDHLRLRWFGAVWPARCALDGYDRLVHTEDPVSRPWTRPVSL